MTVSTRGEGNAGSVFIDANSSLSLSSDARLNASTYGRGNAGDIIINARDRVSLDSLNGKTFIFSSVVEESEGNGGDIRINTGSLLLTNGAQLLADTEGKGDAGNVIIDANRVSFDNESAAFTNVKENATGNGGDVRITTGSLALTNGQIVANTLGKGDAGSVILNARSSVLLDGNIGAVITRVDETGIGNGGNININAETLSVSNGSKLIANTLGQGNAGNVIIDARSHISFNAGEVFSGVESSAIGKGGDIRISADSLSLTNAAQISTATLGRGNAGNAIANVREQVSINSASSFVTRVGNESVGNGGDIRISTKLVFLTDGSQLIANTRGLGDAGNIQINANDAVNISGASLIEGLSSALFTDTNSIGKGGDITVNTNIFRISDGAVLDARTRNNGKGGDVTVNANLFEAINGGQLITTTSGSGRAGKITVNATDKIIVNGSDVTFNDRFAKFGARVANPEAASGFFVRSEGSGTAGDIEVTSPKVTVDNQGKFIAQSASGNGGNINLQVSDLLLLRRDSQISATAGTAQQGGDGGNININSKYIIALREENSDITANAFNGKGGNVQINSQGIFGIEARAKLTDYSDITASSDLGVAGTIALNAPDTSSLQNSLIQLPQNVIDTNALLANSCIVRRNNPNGSTFFIKGSGGLPERPGDAPLSPFSTGAMQSVPIENESPTTTNQSRPWKIGDPIIEPQGFYQLANGKLVLSRECP